MEFTGKNIVISGGAGEIGFEACKQLLKHGAERIALFDISEITEKILALQKEFGDKKILYIKTDVTNEENVDSSFRKVIEQFKCIDIFISSAGIFNDQKIRSTIDINFFGVLNTTLKAMEFMSIEKGGKGGTIAAVSSTVGLVPSFSVPVYCASKHAVVGFIRSLSNEYYYKRHGINMVLICPGLTDTPLVANIETKVLFLDAGQTLLDQMDGYQLNYASDMGKHVMDILCVAKNGSVWIADQYIREVELTHYWP